MKESGRVARYREWKDSDRHGNETSKYSNGDV